MNHSTYENLLNQRHYSLRRAGDKSGSRPIPAGENPRPPFIFINLGVGLGGPSLSKRGSGRQPRMEKPAPMGYNPFMTISLLSCPTVAVLVPVAVPGPYDYAVGDHAVGLGSIVRVPLGSRSVWGVVWGPGSGQVDGKRLKPIWQVSDAPPLSDGARRFVDWVAAYTLSPPGLVMKMALPVEEALEHPKGIQVLIRAEAAGQGRLTQSRQQVLDVLDRLPPLTAADLSQQAGVGIAVVRQMVTAGWVTPQASAAPPVFTPLDMGRPGPVLSDAQAVAAQALADGVGQGYSVSLLDGVTGSGKTEVYLEAVAAAVRRGQQALVLLPEIALSAQWLERFKRRFGQAPAVWHSDLTATQRRQTWRAIVEGQAQVIVGARSALFLPFHDLGLIVVDEEHDGSFKQEENVCYNARDMAVVRAKLGEFPVVLASATPSLETLVNVQAGKYRLQHLPERHGAAQMPVIEAVDLRRTPPPKGRWLAPPLLEAMTQTLASGEQIMLFLNRRGYAPLTLCRACGHRLQCPHCSAWLVEHRARQRLACHHCGHWMPHPDTCPECQAEDSFTACGPGIERIAEEALRLFPDARHMVMASDTIGSPQQASQLVQAMSDRHIDILIGTQIVAKGHHFPYLTLVGVVDADLGLEGGDLRAAERTWQMLFQVAGRAGRSVHPGRVMLQSWQPDHPVIQTLAAGDRDGFLASESESRQAAGMPPFGRLVAVIVSGKDAAALDGFCQSLARQAPTHPAVEIWGPVAAPLSILRGRHRRRFLLKAPRQMAVQGLVRQWLGAIRPPGDIRVQVDVDPYSFM